MAKAKIGLIGLGVMGENLALNIERNGYPIAVYNRTVSKVDDFVRDRGQGKQVIGCHDDKSFAESLETPRKIVLLVKAGSAVDQTIANLKPFLQKGDIIIDGGNSHFTDTIKREKELKEEGFFLIGSGVSGGEEGALWGPSLMPGGDKGAYEQIRPVWEAIAAKVNDGPCVTYLGPNGAGHFVKMVHNGIEYGDMQLIAEIYDVMRRGLGMSASECAETFEQWNTGILDSFLIEITAKILSVIDPETNKPLVDLIVDKAGQKGTGKWTGEIALDLGIAIPTIDAALTARLLSALKDQRVAASKKLHGPKNESANAADKKKLLQALHDALYASKCCSYAQGMALIKAGSDEYKWGIDLGECARIWKGGCIIRAKLLEQIRAAFKRDAKLPNLLVDAEFSAWLNDAQDNWRFAVSTATNLGIAVPALSASLAYYDSYRSANLPQNLTQAQRDFFGAHTFERVDKPDAGFIHVDWPSLVRTKAAKK
ncbi:MAG TPA: NADP-dependent phosphogluconate dehydrogenase [Planktothrix sp.]|jgi:6-phosphogluconate dehydrogenase